MTTPAERLGFSDETVVTLRRVGGPLPAPSTERVEKMETLAKELRTRG